MKKKLLAILLTSTLTILMLPMGINAEWRSDSDGYWYAEGNSWALGWKQIDDNWYYFDKNGYVVKNMVVDGYILGIDGAWVENKQNDISMLKSGKTIIKDYKITIFYEKATGKIVKCVDGVKSYSILDASAKQDELEKKYGIIVIGKDVEVQYGYENYKVINGQIVYTKK
ncbi:hypothetical protein [Clostridium saccharoperbutylacetonicum]|uniref:hypothetical protein n=1 Tax=Clostridium saccharoperbutylacetonicum TaxID=36745 RepID=UPI0039ECC24F